MNNVTNKCSITGQLTFSQKAGGLQDCIQTTPNKINYLFGEGIKTPNVHIMKVKDIEIRKVPVLVYMS